MGFPCTDISEKNHLENPTLKRITQKKRIIKLTAINFALDFLLSIQLFLLYYFQVRNGGFTKYNIILGIIALAFALITFYGNGIYITSILIEDFTIPILKRQKAFKTQFKAIHLFHGPISHILIYSGWLFSFLAISFVKYTSITKYHFEFVFIVSTLAFLSGIAYAYAQIINFSAPFQLISGVIVFTILTIGLYLDPNLLYSSLVPVYFLIFITVFNLFLLGRFTLLKIKGKDIKWNQIK